MKNILIIDRDPHSRESIRRLIETHALEKEQQLTVHTVDNGAEAVMLCELERFHLVFTEIAVSELDGVETVKRIRSRNSNVLIVAISDPDNAEQKKNILHSGAEDYIRKPINPDIFLARLKNYLALIDARCHHLSLHEGHNLFGHNTYARTLSFFVKDYDVLAEFWEYYLLKAHDATPELSDAVRAIHDIGTLCLDCSVKPHIWVEESDSNLYFTIEGLSKVKTSLIQSALKKTPGIANMKSNRSKLCILSPLPEAKITEESVHIPDNAHMQTKGSDGGLSASEEAGISHIASLDTSDAAEIRTFEYMDPEDLENINEYLSRLNTHLLMVGSGYITDDEVAEISYYLDRIAKTASMYPESYPISRALNSLATSIHDSVEAFIEKSASLGMFCKTFGMDLMNWVQTVFYDGAPSVDYMNDTIISNAAMLESMLGIQLAIENQDGDIDDIFAF
ncbi:MAG: response regulator [Sulfuricurvum sp.]|jgi:DNA-binding response OmpR family regulator|nr:response regulator [Sulfuricurvum sp.]